MTHISYLVGILSSNLISMELYFPGYSRSYSPS